MKTTTVADDILVPEFNSPRRTSTVVVAAFNLTATIMGGGVLSIPYAFSKSGKYIHIGYLYRSIYLPIVFIHYSRLSYHRCIAPTNIVPLCCAVFLASLFFVFYVYTLLGNANVYRLLSLTVSLAFSSTPGVLLGTVLMVVAAIITERSLYLLCLCSRLTGAASYGEIGESAFGKNMEYFVSFLISIFLMFAITAYMVLAKDIWTSVFVEIMSLPLLVLSGSNINDTSATATIDGDGEALIQLPQSTTLLLPNDAYVLGITMLMIVPFLVQKSLYALRFNCYIGFSSVSILCLALVHQAWTTTEAPIMMVWPSNSNDHDNINNNNDILWWSTNLDDVLVAFPIISIGFVGIFNILPIQNALIKPTRTRMLQAIDGSILSCCGLAELFGLAGYLYARASTDGNILNNCDPSSDLFLLVGQFCCGITVVLAIPMMLLPCRLNLLEVLDVLIYGPHLTPVEVEESEKLPLIVIDINKDYNSTTTANNGGRRHNVQQCCPQQQNHPKIVETTSTNASSSCCSPNNNTRQFKVRIIDNTYIHYTSTLFIIGTCYMVAVHVPGVAVVWSILGCSMGFLIAFILPSLCYLKIQQRYPNHALTSKAWVWFSWILLCTASVALVACTTETIKRLM